MPRAPVRHVDDDTAGGDVTAALSRTSTVSGRYPGHPLAASLSVVDHAVEWLTYSCVVDGATPTGDGWRQCADALRDPDFFPAWHRSVVDGVVASYGSAPERTVAGYVLQWYLAVPAYLGALLFCSARRVPALDPTRIHLRLGEVAVDGVALAAGPFHCLPGDRDADHPDAVVVADEAALAMALRREIVGHSAWFLRVYGPQVRFGSRTLWAAVTDAIDTGMLLAGRCFGAQELGADDAALVLDRAPDHVDADPLGGSTQYRLVDEHGRTHWTRRRGSCCFHYAIPGQRACTTCPRVCDADRARTLAAAPTAT